jgi:hypothetical protein
MPPCLTSTFYYGNFLIIEIKLGLWAEFSFPWSRTEVTEKTNHWVFLICGIQFPHIYYFSQKSTLPLSFPLTGYLFIETVFPYSLGWPLIWDLLPQPTKYWDYWHVSPHQTKNLQCFRLGSWVSFTSLWLLLLQYIGRSTFLGNGCNSTFFFLLTGVWTQGLHLEPLHQPFF